MVTKTCGVKAVVNNFAPDRVLNPAVIPID